jgi:hypothetical protein
MTSENIFQYLKAHSNRYGPVDQNFAPPNPPGEPTDIQPGTLAKQDLLTQRLKRGEPMWVEGDRTCFDERH